MTAAFHLTQELSELLLFVLPLIDVPKVRAIVAGMMPRLPSPASLLSTAVHAASRGIGDIVGPSDHEANISPRESEESGLDGARDRSEDDADVGPCPVCACAEILLPFQALPCSHVFCYYCIRANCEMDRAFACPKDGKRVQSIRRHRRRGQSKSKS